MATSAAISTPARVRLARTSKPQMITWATLGILLLGLAGLALKTFTGHQATYWMVTEDVPLNANLIDAHLKPVSLNLDNQVYLSASAIPTGFAARELIKGELLATNTIQPTSSSDFSRVVVPSQTSLSKNVRVGTEVEVWAAQKSMSDYGSVALLIETAQVAAIQKGNSPFESGATNVELVLPKLSLAALLDSLASDSAIYLVAKK